MSRTASDKGRSFEKEWKKVLEEIEGRARLTIASGSTFNDHDIDSGMHVCQCKYTTDVNKKSISINLEEFRSLIECARGKWRVDGTGLKVGIYVNGLPTGETLVTLLADDYLDLIQEIYDLRGIINDDTNR